MRSRGDHRLGLVVRDIDRRDAELVVQPADLGAHLLAQLGVQVGQRLVEQQHLRLDDDGAGERHALLLAPGQLGRVAVGQMAAAGRRPASRRRRRSMSARDRRRRFRPKATFCATVMFGQIA